MNLRDHFFDHSGNVNRRFYASSLVGLVWGVALVSAVFPPAALLIFPMFYAIACLTVKRLHDVGLSGKWAMLPLFAVALFIAALLLSGVIAFGAGGATAGAQAKEWAGAVGGTLALGVFLAWAALIVMPGNAHSRKKFGRPPPPMIAPPVPDLKSLGESLRNARPEAARRAAGFGRTLSAGAATFSRINYLKVFFLASGRIGRGGYIAAFGLVLLASLMIILSVGALAAFNWLALLFFFFCTTCLASKRLHDFGMSGWLAGIPFAAFYANAVLLFLHYMIRLGFFGAELRSHPLFVAFDKVGGDATGTILIGSLLAYAVIGLIPGQRGANRHGEAPSLPLSEGDVEAVAA